jgi:hypothetical protein
MIPLKRSLSLAFGLVVLATVAVLITTGTVGASPSLVPLAAAPPTPSIPVNVTNTPLAVSIAGTPTVNANVGTPTVNINGTPTVNLANSASSPVFVDTDRAARNGFNASCGTGDVDPTYGQASCTIFTIPPGREVVIESIACQSILVAGNIPGQANLIVPNMSAGPVPSGQGYYFDLGLSKAASNQYFDIYRVMSPFRIYASAPAQGSVGIGVFFRTDYSASAPQGLSCSIAGYMVQ